MLSRRPNTIPVVFAAPDRAHEELKFVMRRRLKAQAPDRPVSEQELSNQTAHMPFMSLWMERPQFNGAWFNPGRVHFEKNRQTGTVKTMRWPRPMRARVQVDLWAQQDGGEFVAQNVVGQTELLFHSYLVTLPVDWARARWYKEPFNILEHAKVLGQTRIRLYLDDGWTDTTDLEFGDRGKEMRLTWRGRVEGYIPYPPNEARLVREVRYELFDNTDEDNPVLLGTTLVGGDD